MDLKTLKDTPPWEWPDDAGTLIIDTLTDGDAAKFDRQLAARLAGEFTVLSDRLAETLLTIVCSEKEPAELRARAAISLGPGLEEADIGDFDDPDPPELSKPVYERIQKCFRQLFFDANVPKGVRRKILEASVRSPQKWHEGAVRTAYAGDDEQWRLTAVFCMRFVEGFDDQILEALKSTNNDIQYEAVVAAGVWEIDAAWPPISRLVTSANTPKGLLLAAIEAASSIRPGETDIFGDLLESDDEDISDAAMDAFSNAGERADWEDEFDEEDEED